MRKIFKKSYMLVIAFLMMFTSISPQMLLAQQIEEPVLESEVTYDKEHQKATIKLTPVVDQEHYEVKEVRNPEGESMDLENLRYEVVANKDYSFTMRYIKKNEVIKIAPEVKETSESTPVSEEKVESAPVSEEEVESTPEVQEVVETISITDIKTKRELQTTASIEKSNSDLTTKIINEDGSIWDETTWGNGIKKTIEVTANFADTTSEGKKIEFTLPDGMTYVAIPVTNSYEVESGVDKAKLSRLSADEPLNQAITKVTVAKKEAGYHNETFGKTTYEFDKTTEKAKISFVVRVDDWKYYGPHELKQKLVMEAFKSGSSIGKEEKTIHADGKVTRSSGAQDSVQSAFRLYSPSGSKKVVRSTADETSIGFGDKYIAIGRGNASVGETTMLLKKITITLYYPKEMKFEGLYSGNVDYSKDPRIKDLEIDESEGKVVYSYDPREFNITLSVGFSAPEGSELKTYTESRVPQAVFITYDDTVYTVDALSSKLDDTTPLVRSHSFEVVDSLGTKMNIVASPGDFDEGEEGPFGYFGIENQLGRRQNNVMFHVIPDVNFEAYQVRFRKDTTIVGNEITEVQYKTNLNSTYRSYSERLERYTDQIWVLTKEAAKLEEGEYFTDVLANIGGLSNIYKTDGAKYLTSAVAYGKVKPGFSQVSTTLETWIKDNKDQTLASSSSVQKVTKEIDTSQSSSALSFYDAKGSRLDNGVANAGDSITIKGSLSMDYPYGKIKTIKDPEIYLREADVFKINKESIKLTDQNNKNISFTKEERSLLTGEKVIVLKTTGSMVSQYGGYPPQKHRIIISYDVKINTKVTTNTTLDVNTLVAWGNKNITSYGPGSNAYRSFDDVGFDMDGDGNDNEYLLGVFNASLDIPKSDKVIVNTYLSVPGEEAKEYVEGDDNTLTYYTPGTASEYIFRIENLSSEPSSSFELYAPIPKTGQNFGVDYQKEEFKWNMKMTGVPTFSNGNKFDVSYSTNADSKTIEDSTVYTPTVNDYGKVNAVRFTMREALLPGEVVEVKIPIAIDETHASAESKVKTRNIFNPRFKITSTSYKGILPASKVGAELVIAEIGGVVFNDIDSDGLYDGSKDNLVQGHKVSLYKWNEIKNDYEEALDDSQKSIKATTDAQGKFKFDHNQKIGYGKYALKFEQLDEDHRYTVYNKKDTSNNNVNSSVINTGLRTGWIDDIDATKASAGQLGAGIIVYHKADMKITGVENSYAVKMNKTIEIKPIIAPTTFDSIKDANAGYQWEIVSAEGNAYISLSANDKKDVKVIPSKTTLIDKPVELKLTIKDMFGSTTSVTTKISVQSNDAPVITTLSDEIVLNVGEDWDPLKIPGLAINDDHDTITIDDLTIDDEVPVGDNIFWIFKGPNSGKLNKAGTYRVTFSYIDSDSNKVVKEVKVKVNGLPYIKANNAPDPNNTELPEKYARVRQNSELVDGLEIYWKKASDNYGDSPVETLINKDDSTTGVLDYTELKDKDGNIISTTNIPDAGKYNAKIEASNLSKGKTTFNRVLYVRGKITGMNGNSIVIRDDPNVYNNLDELLKVYGDRIDLKAIVKTVDETGKVEDQAITDFRLKENISKVSFDRKDTNQPEVHNFNVSVHDKEGAYAEETEVISFSITVQTNIGEVPTINFKAGTAPTVRVSTDKVLKNAFLLTEEDYEKSEDLASLDDVSNSTVIYDKLMDDAIIEDPNSSGDTVGIKESGIEQIVQLYTIDGVAGGSKVLIKNDAEAKNTPAILLGMYKNPGHYAITYYAIDNDGNKTVNTRHIHTSGETKFVNSEGKEADETMNIRVGKVPYQPRGVQAQHLHYDGTTIHKEIAEIPSPININIPGMYEVNFKNSHHAGKYGETDIDRPKDNFTQKFLVHGDIKIKGITPEIEKHFKNEEVRLDQATASFTKAIVPVNKNDPNTEEITLKVTNSIAEDSITWNEVGVNKVTYHVDDQLGLQDSKQSLEKEYHVYGLPVFDSINDKITIGEHATKDEVAKSIAAKGSIEMPDSSRDTIAIESNYKDFAATGDTITVTGSYTLGTTTKTVTREVAVTKVKKPQLEANDITIQVGELLDLKSRSKLKITHDYLTIDDVNVFGSIPTSNGIATSTGTYEVIFNAKDKQGSESKKTIIVKVDGAVTLQGLHQIQIREGGTLDLEKGVSASYEKAHPTVGKPAVNTKFDVHSSNDTLEISKYEVVDETGNRKEVTGITSAGVYEVTYQAMTEGKAMSEAKRIVIVHGKPTLNVRSIAIRTGESETNFLEKFTRELSIQSNVLKTEWINGMSVFTELDLLSENKVSIDLSEVNFDQEGSYKAVVKAIADYDEGNVPKESIEKTILITVGKIQGELPVITTHDKKRQVDDPIIDMSNVEAYLLSEKLLKIDVKDYDIRSKTIKSIERITKTRANTSIDVNDNEALKKMMKTIGMYKITYRIEDMIGNVMESSLMYEVNGAISFGYKGSDGKIIDLDRIIEVRRKDDSQYRTNDIVAYRTNAKGILETYPVYVAKGDTSIHEVAVKPITLTYTPAEPTYEDGTPRIVARKDVKVLVQGNIVFEHDSNGKKEIQTYVGSSLDLKKLGKAFIETIDEFETIKRNEVSVEVRKAVTTRNIGVFEAVVEAMDDISNAPNKTATSTIKIHVNGVPEIRAKKSIEVLKNTSRSVIIEQLGAQAWYINSLNERVDLSNQIQYSEIKGNEVKISVSYNDQGTEKTIETSSKVIIKESSSKDEEILGVETGDNVHVNFYIGLALSSSMIGFILLVLAKRRKKEGKI